MNLFTIITQYKATFTDDENVLVHNDSEQSDFSNVFHNWLHKRVNSFNLTLGYNLILFYYKQIEIFLHTLEYDLKQGVHSIDTILGQCMYFGLSFSRVGADFRGLMAPIFYNVILTNFKTAIFKATRQFESDIESYTLINKIASSTPPNAVNKSDNLLPPESLLDFYPLAIYCNGILTALNELRHCSPVALANDVTATIQKSLENVANNILHFYRQEQQAFVVGERENLIRFCSCFAYDLVPYMQRCIQEIYPATCMTAFLGINSMALQKCGLTIMKEKQILGTIERLLPDKCDTSAMQSVE